MKYYYPSVSSRRLHVQKAVYKKSACPTIAIFERMDIIKFPQYPSHEWEPVAGVSAVMQLFLEFLQPFRDNPWNILMVCVFIDMASVNRLISVTARHSFCTVLQKSSKKQKFQ